MPGPLYGRVMKRFGRLLGISLMILAGLSIIPVFGLVAGDPGPSGIQDPPWYRLLAAAPFAAGAVGALLLFLSMRKKA